MIIGILSIIGLVILIWALSQYESGDYGPADEPRYESEQEAWDDIVDNPARWG